MKIKLSIETADGREISSFQTNDDISPGWELVAAASNADLLMLYGISYDQFRSLGIAWNGVRFKAKVIE